LPPYLHHFRKDRWAGFSVKAVAEILNAHLAEYKIKMHICQAAAF